MALLSFHPIGCKTSACGIMDAVVRLTLPALFILLVWAWPTFAQSTAPSPRQREDELHAQFFQSQGNHFTILFEGPQDQELAFRALDVLEAAYFRIAAALSDYPDRTITVVLYTQQQFRDITRAPAWAAGAYDGKIRVPIRGALARPEELTRVLTHELAHAMLHAAAPRGLPGWLNEGLAVAFEPNGIAWAESELARTDARLDVRQFTRSFASLSGEAAVLAYAQSAMIARRMLDENGGGSFLNLLHDLSGGTPFADAFEERFLIPVDTFVADLTPER